MGNVEINCNFSYYSFLQKNSSGNKGSNLNRKSLAICHYYLNKLLK